MDVRSFTFDQTGSTDEPVNIFTALLHRTLGDFVDQLLFAASVKEAYGKVHLFVYYRPDRPYKKDIVSLSPQVDICVTPMDGWPVDAFDTAFGPPISASESFNNPYAVQPDIILTPSMCHRAYFGNLPRLAQFTLPDQDLWDQRLSEKIKPSWFAVIHYRDGTFSHSRPNAYRDLEGTDPNDIVDRIIDRGGQAVRIGHPEMQPLRPRPGYIDLASAPFLEQVAAINRARFFFELTPSGPVSLATAFGTPLMRCNALDLLTVASGYGASMPQRVLDPGGKDVTFEAVREGYFRRRDRPEFADYRLRRNSDAQILEGLDMMIDRTRGDGWREAKQHKPTDPIGTLGFPLRPKMNVQLII